MNKEKKESKNKLDNVGIIINIIYAIIISLYFISLNFINIVCPNDIFQIYIKASYTVFIFVAILIFEIAYKQDNGITSIYGIEFIVLAIHILLIERFVTILNLEITKFILVTSYIWPIYYCLKSIIIQTNENRKKLKQASDIAEIVKEEKPTKKVAKKRKK